MKKLLELKASWTTDTDGEMQSSCPDRRRRDRGGEAAGGAWLMQVQLHPLTQLSGPGESEVQPQVSTYSGIMSTFLPKFAREK